MNKKSARKSVGRRLSVVGFSSGYVAIISAIIISIIVAIVLVSLGQVSFFNRINISDAHLKEKSRALAEACADTAFLKLARNSAYAGNETITVASDTCKVVSVTASGTARIVTTQGAYQGSYTNLKITIPTSTVSVTGWEETQN